MTHQNTIAFVGAGNLAGGIIRGLVKQGYPAQSIIASAATRKNLDPLESELSIKTGTDSATTCEGADIVVLGVKPQIMESVCHEIASHIQPGALVISLAAGITCKSLESWLGTTTAIVRCMTNTPARIGLGASGLFANGHCTDNQKEDAQNIINAVGISHWVDSDALIDTVTALAGSGPAYFFLFLESMVDAAIAQGMNKETATELAIQTALGAATLAQQSEDDLVQLRKNVTSPNGTTQRAIESFEKNNVRKVIQDAVDDCAERARELAAQ